MMVEWVKDNNAAFIAGNTPPVPRLWHADIANDNLDLLLPTTVTDTNWEQYVFKFTPSSTSVTGDKCPATDSVKISSVAQEILTDPSFFARYEG
jgi:hypothetical protein